MSKVSVSDIQLYTNSNNRAHEKVNNALKLQNEKRILTSLITYFRLNYAQSCSKCFFAFNDNSHHRVFAFFLFASFSLRNPTPTYVSRQLSGQQSLLCMLPTSFDKNLTFTAPMKLINYSHTSLSFNNTVFHLQRIKGKCWCKRMITNFHLYSRCMCRPGRLYNKFIHTRTHTGRQRCPQLRQQMIGTALHYKTILKLRISKRI